MADGYRMIERWTLRSLVGAFLDLAIAYIFLCAAAVAFAAAKFFSFFGVDLSCRHSPPFPLRPSPPRPPSCCSPHRPLLILDNNNNYNNNNNNTESESELESPAPPPPLRLGWRRDEPIPVPLSYTTEQLVDPLDEQEINKRTIFEKLKRVVEEERAMRAALTRELEEERSAAASAADEAMAMMLRLQEEKAAAEIEARQYRRMVEEKSAFDAEEMAALKEIVVRREREKFVLEMQLEECQQLIMMITNNGGGGGDPDAILGGNSRERRCGDINNLHSIDQDDVAGIDGRVYDVHVIDDHKMSLDDEKNAEHLKPSHTESGSSESATAEQSYDISSSLSVVDVEKLVLEKEVALLRKRLEAIQQGRERLRFPLDQTEKETLRLQILKEISYHLEEIKKSTEEAGEAILHTWKISY